MANFVRVRIRGTFWSASDSWGELLFRDSDFALSNNILSGANFVSGPRSVVAGVYFGNDGIEGSDDGPVDEEFTFVIPPGELPDPAECRLVFSFGYQPYEIDISLSDDGVSFALAGSGEVVVLGDGSTDWFSLTQTAPSVLPFWTDYVLTREEGVS